MLLIILWFVDMVIRSVRTATGATPWPAHILASLIQIIAMVRNINALFVVITVVCWRTEVVWTDFYRILQASVKKYRNSSEHSTPVV